MTPDECLQDELKYLNNLLQFFEKIKYEVLISNVKTRISIVEKKLQTIPEPIY